MSVVANLRSRLGNNIAPLTARLRTANGRRAKANWLLLIASVLVGLVIVIAVGLLIDGPVIDWTRTLPEWIHGLFRRITRLGRSDWLLIPTGAIALAVVLGDWRNVSRPVAAAWWEIGTFAAVLFLVIAASGLTTDLLKPIVGRMRPEFVADGAFEFNPFTLGGYSHYSFPSGHATTMGAVAVFAAFAPGVLTIPILAGTALVAISRVVIGVHYPSDVVGGALIGIGVGYLILRAMASAGIVFVVRPDGSISRRLGVFGRLRRSGSRLSGLAGGLFRAWRGPG
jgi:membrane-associated phospholipid phosphatase